MRVFLDTNVLASSIATRGLCSELFEGVIHDHELLTCGPVLEELERTLREKFGLPEPVIVGFLDLLKADGIEVRPGSSDLSLAIRDSADIHILACAIGGKADVFVTGDRELLRLGKLKNLSIASPRQLWNRLAGLA